MTTTPPSRVHDAVLSGRGPARRFYSWQVSSPRVAPRRTQAQRRATTIGALLDAAITSIAEIGYAKTTVVEIVTRAGLSQGALFRHFPTRLDLMIAVAQEVGERQISSFTAEFGTSSADATPRDMREAVLLVRDLATSDINIVLRELTFHARIDEALRTRLSPILENYYAQMTLLADGMPELQELTASRRRTLVMVLIAAFDGEALRKPLAPDPDADTARIDMLMLLAESYGVTLS